MSNMFSYCKSLTNLNLPNFNTQNATNTYDIFLGCESLSSVKEFEHKIKEEERQKIMIICETTSQVKTKIIIDPNRAMKDLIQLYFKENNRPELYGDSSIRFFMNANFIPHGSKDLIKKYINQKNDINFMVVDDLDDKIFNLDNNIYLPDLPE